MRCQFKIKIVPERTIRDVRLVSQLELTPPVVKHDSSPNSHWESQAVDQWFSPGSVLREVKHFHGPEAGS